MINGSSQLKISDFTYELPDERIAKFPLDRRELSKLLIYKAGDISHRQFINLGEILPSGSLLVFNNTKVIRARIIMHKSSGARIEVFCLEPHEPADYERAFSVRGECSWHCIIGNSKKWKEGPLSIPYSHDGQQHELRAWRVSSGTKEQIVRFEWSSDQTFGQLLELLGRIPIPPYLNRESEAIDNTRYQTVYSKLEGSVAAPTAGLHFSEQLIDQMRGDGFNFDEVTLHVGAGTFLPVKSEDARDHAMHTEHFEISAATISNMIDKLGRIVAVGTTSVRTLESLNALGYRVMQNGTPDEEITVGQWEIYDIPDTTDGAQTLAALLDYMTSNKLTKIKAATQIMITPGYRFRVVDNIITNFHQPQSTLLLLVSAFVGDDWKQIYEYALRNDFRFLSYGDSSLLMKNEK